MASLDDILTAQKNGVIAINAYVSSLNFHAGQTQSLEMSTTTTLKTKAGWIANVAVIVAGSTSGFIYDTLNSANLTGTRIYLIPNVVGVYVVNLPTNNGIVVVPGTGQIVSLGFS